MFLFGGAKMQSRQAPAISGLQIQSSAFGKAIPLCYGTNKLAPNLMWYGDFKSIAQNSSAGSGGKGGVGGGGGGKGGGGAVTYIYQTAVMMGACEGPIVGFGNVYVDKNVKTIAALGLTTFLGSYSQTAWGYLTTNHPSEALDYRGIASAASAAYQLGNSPQLPNHNFEIQAIYSDSIASHVDADPSLVIADYLSNTKHGVGFPSGKIGDLTSYQQYTIANGLWISPFYVQQSQASNHLDDIALNTNSEWVWSSGKLTLVPRGDQTITANGYTYTAPSAPSYDLTDDDFISLNKSAGTSSGSTNTDPVLCTRKRPADAFNTIKLEYLDRSNQYNPAIVEAKDQAAIDSFGLRADATRSAHLFCDATAARLSVQLQLQRQFVRNNYTFTLDQRYILLDPMDIVTLTDTKLGLNQQWVRIIEITENDDYTLTFIAEEYLSGTGSAAIYSFAQGSGFNADYNESPGDANTPIIFEPPVQIADLDLEIWLALSGGSLWGGCDVYISSDNSTYRLIGRQTGPARMGQLTATLGDFGSANPDTGNQLKVDLTESLGELLSGTTMDAQQLHTLCYVDGEILSYATATLTASNKYTLTYMYRGAYATPISSHANGSNFARLDDGIFVIPYDKSRIGQTLYIKLLSFNIYGGGEQSLADVQPNTYVIVGPPVPTQVQNFAVAQQGNVVVFTWDDLLPNDVGLKGYDIAYAPVGTTEWDAFTLLTEAARATEMTNAAVPPGSWTFAIRAHDIADQLGPMTTFDLVVVNQNDDILDAEEDPEWLGNREYQAGSLIQHYNGTLIPRAFDLANEWGPIGTPDTPGLDQTAGGTFAATTYYVKQTLVDIDGSETNASVESNFAVDLDNLLVVLAAQPTVFDFSSNIQGWNVYVGTVSGILYKQNAVVIPDGTDWTQPTSGLITSGSTPPTRDLTGWETFDIFVPYPLQDSPFQYESLTYDTGIDDEVRVFMTYQTAPGPGNTGTAFKFQTQIATWLTAGVEPAPVDWTIGLVTMRYIIGSFLYYVGDQTGIDALDINPGNTQFIKRFQIVVDKAPEIEQASSVTVAPGGSTITFPQAYHTPPFVQATVVGATSLKVTVASITATNFIAHVWNDSGSDVGGVINWSATGE